MSLTTYRMDEIASMKYGKMPPKDILSDEGFPVYSGYKVTGYAREFLYEEPMLVLVARGVGGTGDVKIAPAKAWITNLSIVLTLNEKVDKRYLYYKLNREGLKEKLNTGAAQAQITIENFSPYKINVPPLDQQKKIVSVLSVYDDLIENNRRRIELLEESARQLYKEWFVRFRFPGHEHVKIIDGIPEGWEAHKLGKLLSKVKRPGKIKKDDFVDDGPIPCVDQSQSFIGGYTFDEEATITSPLPLIVFGDHTRCLKFIDFPFACGADGTQLLKPSDERLTIQYFYYAVDAVDLSNYFYARHFKFLKDQIVLIPETGLVSDFTEFAQNSLKQISTLRETNRQLAQARDLLLPKLMSGEVAV